MPKPKSAVMDKARTRALPSESCFELQSDYLQLHDGGNQAPAHELLESASALDYKAIQNALLQALSANGWTNWRAVCPQIYVERGEPHRTIVFDKASLCLTKIWLDSRASTNAFVDESTLAGSNSSLKPTLCLSAQVHSPLSDAPPKPITINL